MFNFCNYQNLNNLASVWIIYWGFCVVSWVKKAVRIKFLHFLDVPVEKSLDFFGHQVLLSSIKYDIGSFVNVLAFVFEQMIIKVILNSSNERSVILQFGLDWYGRQNDEDDWEGKFDVEIWFSRSFDCFFWWEIFIVILVVIRLKFKVRSLAWWRLLHKRW